MNMVIFPDSIGKVTEKAFQVRMDNELVWLPKSQTKAQVKEIEGVKHYRVILPYWLADEKGFLAKTYNGMNLYTIQETQEVI